MTLPAILDKSETNHLVSFRSWGVGKTHFPFLKLPKRVDGLAAPAHRTCGVGTGIKSGTPAAGRSKPRFWTVL